MAVATTTNHLTDHRSPGSTAPSTCMATYSVTSSWDADFQAEVDVMNHRTTPMDGWTVDWTTPDGQHVDSVWEAP